MHTLTMTAAGLLLLAAFALIGRRLGGARGLARAARAFIPVWLAASVVNLWVGVAQAGYTVAQELPILAVIFGVPAAAAVLVLRRAAAGRA